MTKLIQSKSNETYKRIAKIVKKGPSSGFFVIEGVRAIEQALSNGASAEIIVGTHDDSQIDYQLSPELFHKLSSVKTPQGILGIFNIPKKDFKEASKYLILDRISDPGNLGTILRTALAFDYTNVLLTKGSVSVYNPKVIRSSLSSVLSMNIVENVSEEELKDILKERFTIAAALKNSVDFRKETYQGDVSIIIGNEANGISDNVLALADRVVHIPMSQSMESLNAAVASAILLEYFYNIC